eukprot:6214498-Pleurochrysis_carterae.AAC.9
MGIADGRMAIPFINCFRNVDAVPKCSGGHNRGFKIYLRGVNATDTEVLPFSRYYRCAGCTAGADMRAAHLEQRHVEAAAELDNPVTDRDDHQPRAN